MKKIRDLQCGRKRNWILPACVFLLNSFSFADTGAGSFAAEWGGVGNIETAFNRDSEITVDQQTGILKISGVATDQARANKYLAAELTFTAEQNLTAKAATFEFKGDPGDLFVRMSNRGSVDVCMAFKGYRRVEPTEWRSALLRVGSGSGGFSWDAGLVRVEVPDHVDKISFIYRPAAMNCSASIEIRNLRLEEVQVADLKRSISSPLTVNDIKPIAAVTTLVKGGQPVAAVIVPGDRPLSVAEEQALAQLNEKYGVTFASYKLEEGQLSLPEGNYILFGDGVRGLIVNRLLSRMHLNPEPGYYEVRNIRNAFQGGCNILYFGGSTNEKMLEGVSRFVSRQETASADWAIGEYYDLEEFNSSVQVAGRAEMCAAILQEIRDIYTDSNRGAKNTDAIRVISNLSRQYNNTGDENLVKPFIQLMKIMADNYELAKTWRKSPPSFRAQELAFAVDLIDESESFVDEDLVLCGNLLRRISEDCMNYYEMREPMRLYDSKKTGYLTNHPLFASRSVSAIARFLKKRFDVPTGDYWIAVSANAYKEIAAADQGPEDSSNYQWMCRKLYNKFALQSGDVPLITPNFKGYVDFAISHFNQMGRVVSYGDSIPMKELSPIHPLIFGYKYYNDRLSGHVLNSISTSNDFIKTLVRKMGLPENVDYEPRMTGLTVFQSCDFLKKYFKIETERALLNKAVFRSGYEPEDEYLMLGGINVPKEHGHLDANAIVEYSRDDRYWLIDGDYIKHFPREHNTITVSRDATLPDQRRSAPITKNSFSEIDGMASAPDGSSGITATSLRNYNGVDWTRNIFWSSLNGFWVIDRLNANEPGRYVIKCLWRTLGEVSVAGNSVEVRQKKAALNNSPDRLFIARGDSASTTVFEQFDYGHEGSFGYYDFYAFAGPVTKVISEVNELELSQGAQLEYVNFFETGHLGSSEKPQIRRAGSSAWIVDGKTMQLAALGEFKYPGITLKAERALVSPEGILVEKATELQIGGQVITLSGGENFYGRFGEGCLSNVPEEKIRNILAGIYAGSEETSLQDVKTINAPELAVEQRIETPVPVAAMATSSSRIVCGFENGRVIGYNLAGSQLWQSNVGAPVNALCPIKDGDRTLWAVGTQCDNRKGQTGYVALISSEGRLLWKNSVAPYRGRPGTVRSITGAKLLPGNSQQVVVGSEAWKYLAFDLDGKELWSFPVFHASTVCAAADMTGDGLDEIAAGTEYYYHWILNAKGEKVKTVLSSPGDYCVATLDVTGDGNKETVWGRGDGYIKVMRPGDKEKRYLWDTNVGGLPTGIIETSSGDLAVSTANNAVVFVNRSGEKTGAMYFPDALCGIKRVDGFLYTACRDGHVYKFTETGVVGKVKILNFVNNTRVPLLGSDGQKLVVGFDRYITVMK